MVYDGSKIKVLKGLDAVRKRPGMYIGDIGKNGYHHCVWEIVDNAIDEKMAGYCDQIIVTLYENEFLSVQDNGRGIPVDMHVEGVSAATVVMTMLHAGGKFDNENNESAYKTAGGLHGVGASVVNALSSEFDMLIDRDGYSWNQSFRNGGVPVAPLVQGKKSLNHGTFIKFRLDRSIFKIEEDEPVPEFDRDIIAKSLAMRASLNPGLEIILIDDVKKTKESWCSHGFEEILDIVSTNRSIPVLPPISVISKVETKNGPVEVMVAMRVHVERESVIMSFANNIITHQGGTHDAGFRSAVLRAFNRYAEDNKLIKDSLLAEDVREGLVAAVSVRLTDPQFQGQTKDRLTNTECSGAVQSATYQMIGKFFEENPKEAKNIIQRAERAAKMRSAAEKARKMIERENPLQIGSLPGKLADCQNSDPALCELFLVEGDSAGGSAKQGRDRKFQAILPLKGKPMNVWRTDEAKAFGSEEIQNILQVLRCGAGIVFNISKLSYHKIIIMTDADVDGAHIQTLLLTLFHKLMPQLIAGGYVYIAMPPLYRVSKGKGDPHWISHDEALEVFFKTASGDRDSWNVQRFKGLGEMNPEQLWETTMNPRSRSLMRVCYADAEESSGDNVTFDLLMGDDVAPRCEFIQTHANFAHIDF